MSTEPARTVPVRLINFTAGSPEELRDICDIWLSSICAAGWSTREAQRVGAFLTTCIYGNREADLYLRDVESALNIQPEESQRALKVLKLFGAIEDMTIERGKLTVDVRVTLEQRVRLVEQRGKLAGLAAAEGERAMNAGIAALRAVSGKASQPRYAFDDAELKNAIGE